ncbi:hypothetical protein GC194_05150 [bacterium]|nr:hypothetical protein [bacterium]
MNKDLKNLITGTALGFFVPFVGLAVFYFIKFSSHSLGEYVSTMNSHHLMAPVISVSLVPNILLFFFYLNRNKFKQGQGVILSMLIWGVAVVYFKFLA